MGRVLVALLVLTLGWLAARGLASGLRAERRRVADAQGRYRPHRPPRSRARAGKDTKAGPGNTRAIVRRSALAHLRDALTGGPLDPDAELFRCADCQSFYGVASVRALANDNGARCINCGSIDRIDVEVVP